MFYIGRLSLSVKVSRYRTINAAHQSGILISLPEIPIKADELAANDDCINYLTGGGSVLGKLPSMELCNITSPQRHIKALKDTLKENSDIKKLSLIVGTNLSIKLTDFYPLFLHILCSSASNFLHFLTVSFTAITESWLHPSVPASRVPRLPSPRCIGPASPHTRRNATSPAMRPLPTRLPTFHPTTHTPPLPARGPPSASTTRRPLRMSCRPAARIDGRAP